MHEHPAGLAEIRHVLSAIGAVILAMWTPESTAIRLAAGTSSIVVWTGSSSSDMVTPKSESEIRQNCITDPATFAEIRFGRLEKADRMPSARAGGDQDCPHRLVSG